MSAYQLVNPARGHLATPAGRKLRGALGAAARGRITGSHWHVLLTAPRTAFGGPGSARAEQAYACLQRVVTGYPQLRPAPATVAAAELTDGAAAAVPAHGPAASTGPQPDASSPAVPAAAPVPGLPDAVPASAASPVVPGRAVPASAGPAGAAAASPAGPAAVPASAGPAGAVPLAVPGRAVPGTADLPVQPAASPAAPALPGRGAAATAALQPAASPAGVSVPTAPAPAAAPVSVPSAAAVPAAAVAAGTAPAAPATAVPVSLVEDLRTTVELGAVLCVTAPAASAGLGVSSAAAVVAAALEQMPVLLSALWVRPHPETDERSLRRALYTGLGLDQEQPQPRAVNRTLELIAAELDGSGRLLVVPDAHRLSPAALQTLYGLWAPGGPERFALVLVGEPALHTVLDRPELASLKSCVFIRHRLAPAPAAAGVPAPAAEETAAAAPAAAAVPTSRPAASVPGSVPAAAAGEGAPPAAEGTLPAAAVPAASAGPQRHAVLPPVSGRVTAADPAAVAAPRACADPAEPAADVPAAGGTPPAQAGGPAAVPAPTPLQPAAGPGDDVVPHLPAPAQAPVPAVTPPARPAAALEPADPPPFPAGTGAAAGADPVPAHAAPGARTGADTALPTATPAPMPGSLSPLFPVPAGAPSAPAGMEISLLGVLAGPGGLSGEAAGVLAETLSVAPTLASPAPEASAGPQPDPGTPAPLPPAPLPPAPAAAGPEDDSAAARPAQDPHRAPAPAAAPTPAPGESTGGGLTAVAQALSDTARQRGIMTLTGPASTTLLDALAAVASGPDTAALELPGLDTVGPLTVWIHPEAPTDRAALLRTLYTRLDLDRHGPQPRAVADTTALITAELQRTHRPVIVTRAHLLRTDALEHLYSVWKHTRFTLVLAGDQHLDPLLGRPRLEGLNSHVFLRHRLPAAATGHAAAVPGPAAGIAAAADPAALASPPPPAAAPPAAAVPDAFAPPSEPAPNPQDAPVPTTPAGSPLQPTGTAVPAPAAGTGAVVLLPAAAPGSEAAPMPTAPVRAVAPDPADPGPGTRRVPTRDIGTTALPAPAPPAADGSADRALLPTAAPAPAAFDSPTGDPVPAPATPNPQDITVPTPPRTADTAPAPTLSPGPATLHEARSALPQLIRATSEGISTLLTRGTHHALLTTPTTANALGWDLTTADLHGTADARKKLGDLIQHAATGHPQVLRRHTTPVAVLLPATPDGTPLPPAEAPKSPSGSGEDAPPAALATAGPAAAPAVPVAQPAPGRADPGAVLPPAGPTSPGPTPAAQPAPGQADPAVVLPPAGPTPTTTTSSAPVPGTAPDSRPTPASPSTTTPTTLPRNVVDAPSDTLSAAPAAPTGQPAPTSAAPAGQPAVAPGTTVPSTAPDTIAPAAVPAGTPVPEPAADTATPAAPVTTAAPSVPTAPTVPGVPGVVPPGTSAAAPATDTAVPAAEVVPPTPPVPAAAVSRTPRRLAPLAQALDAVLTPTALASSTTAEDDPTTPTGPRGLPTGIPTLDDILGGLQPGRFYLAAAAPGTGASLLATTAARTTALDHHQPVLYAASGLTRADIAARIVAAHLPVDYRRLRTGRLNPTEQADATTLQTELAAAPLYIDDGTDLTPTAIAETITDLPGLALVVVDRLQAADDPRLPLSGPRLTDAAQALAHLARTHHVPVLAILDTDHPDLITTLGLDTTLTLHPHHPTHRHHTDPTTQVLLTITERDLGPQATLTLTADLTHARLTDYTPFDPHADIPHLTPDELDAITPFPTTPAPEATTTPAPEVPTHPTPQAPHPTTTAPEAPTHTTDPAPATPWPPVTTPGHPTPTPTAPPTPTAAPQPGSEPTPANQAAPNTPATLTPDQPPTHPLRPTQAPAARTAASKPARSGSGDYAGRDYGYYLDMISSVVEQTLQEHGGDTDAAITDLEKKAIPNGMALFEATRVGGNYEHTVYPERLEFLSKKSRDGADDIWEGRHKWENGPLMDQLKAGTHPDVDVEVLDTNAAFCSALKTWLPIGALQHQPDGGFDPRRAGIYLLPKRPTWEHPHLPDPIGNRREPGPVLLDDATIRLLIRCHKLGLAEAPHITQAWTSGATENLVEKFRRVLTIGRENAILEGDDVTEKYIKAIYAKFVSTIGESTFNRDLRRPDWMHIIRSQAFANLWYKAHRAHEHGLTIVRLRGTDELHITGDTAWRTVFNEGRLTTQLKLKTQYTLNAKAA
ncbi:AAA family ATPase [Kitasatospora sp. NBC_00240]|uniref:DnaB-like helicase C-terminal domain-containing protein n=1 Tax=Kitasatospora sp. NBC_00240 TaxID=2903567 RepID=UPI00225BDFE1|nr:DnaB-like helicase C-terminal domain-containing protein [Kitasatospora sp. NBC_00240]MCX5216174.1 AAA family ATPase [Kitasatospora sp. NBC_00240]